MAQTLQCFLLDKSSSLDAIGLAESDNKDLAKNGASCFQFCESAAVSQEPGNCVMMVVCANTLLQSMINRLYMECDARALPGSGIILGGVKY